MLWQEDRSVCNVRCERDGCLALSGKPEVRVVEARTGKKGQNRSREGKRAGRGCEVRRRSGVCLIEDH